MRGSCLKGYIFLIDYLSAHFPLSRSLHVLGTECAVIVIVV